LSALSARAADGEASFAAAGAPWRAAWPLLGDGGTKTIRAPASPRHVPNPHHTKAPLGTLRRWDPPPLPDFGHHDLCAFARTSKICKWGCGSQLAPGVWRFSLPFAGNAEGLPSRHQPQSCFPAGGTTGDRGQRRTQGAGSCVWVSRGAGQDCGSQQTHAFLKTKSSWGLEPDEGLWQSPGTPPAAKRRVGFAGQGRALQR